MFDYTHLVNSEKQSPSNIFFNNLELFPGDTEE